MARLKSSNFCRMRGNHMVMGPRFDPCRFSQYSAVADVQQEKEEEAEAEFDATFTDEELEKRNDRENRYAPASTEVVPTGSLMYGEDELVFGDESIIYAP